MASETAPSSLVATCDIQKALQPARRAFSPIYAADEMQRQYVDSRVIWSIGYDPMQQILELEFRETREVYQYFEVPPEEHAALFAADSKGTYLNQVFKTKGYRYRRIQ